jgi:UDP-glucose 4-epimerase
VAARLLSEKSGRIIGLDVVPPPESIPGLDFIQADVRNPLLIDLLKAEGVNAVCHLAFSEAVWPSQATFDLNVMGTMHLLGACAEAGVRKVVLRSSTAVYGARPGNPAFLTEDHALRGSQQLGFIRDLIEIEKYFSGFSRRRPEMVLTSLRFASVVGPTAVTPMTRFLRDTWAPTLLGFDPLVQLVHEDDAVRALVHAVHHDVLGAVNVAARDALPLNKVRALAGKPPVSLPHPLAYWGARLVGSRGLPVNRYLPIDPDYLRYPWVADLTRMRDDLGFEPQYTAVEALLQFAERNCTRESQPEPADLARSEERLREVLEARRRAIEAKGTAAIGLDVGGVHE